MDAKPKVAVFVLCSTERTGWINPYLVSSLMRLQRDPRMDIQLGMLMDRRPVEHARNLCIVESRGRGADMCVQIDNDMTLPPDFADIVLEAHETCKAVVALACGALPSDGPKMIPEDNGPSEGKFRQTERGGGGALIISSEVWRVIPSGPWFRWLANNDETLSRHVSEDYYFCWLTQTNGLKVWTHQSVAGHLKTDDATKWVLRLKYLENSIQGATGAK